MNSCGQIFFGRSRMTFVRRFVLFPVMQICCLAMATVWTRLQRHQIYSDIYDDSEWLIGVVENLLSITRLNDGRLKFKFTDQLLDEVIAESPEAYQPGNMMIIKL